MVAGANIFDMTRLQTNHLVYSSVGAGLGWFFEEDE
jgi:hypothetical protein